MNNFSAPPPKIVTPNLITDPEKMRQFSAGHGFEGIDWSFDLAHLPATPAEESRWARRQELLKPLEVRYHCPFLQVDIGHEDKDVQASAMDIFRRMIRLVSKARRKYLSIHVGLGHNTTKILSWESSISNLRQLVRFGVESGVTVCLENLIWGWSSKPNLFEKMVRKSGASVTFDFGHAYSCESIESQTYAVKDFVTPHADRVVNAHIYHKEVSGMGHFPPERLEDIAERLDLLRRTPCRWWVLELKNVEDLLKTKIIVEEYLKRSEDQ
ncbi:MAG: sugar phosphate isomerase/epimerase [Desulfobacteraceae bacterium]|nr:sugar phosphate isomerase/epimerase [Desulfobacteraceae bacterium]MBC2755339.1 sugar phosphate isomerase/epimerase [Desulfobacteraceae bacterium]